MTGTVTAVAPAPVPLGTAPSFGFGDRLGLATPGHARAVRETGAVILPVFAQQSARELARTGRTHAEVLAAARSGLDAAGWTGLYGADADHCKTAADVEAGVEGGCTMFTLDPSDAVEPGAAGMDRADLEREFRALPWEELEDTPGDLLRRHADGIELDVSRLTPDPEQVARAAVKYLRAVGHAAVLVRGIPAGLDLELSVDETPTATTIFEHAFVSTELARREVGLTSLAPRFPGRFEKGIEYRGDLAEFAAAARGHAEVARALGGYKLSLHSGSDKLSLYPIVAEETLGRFHVKTAGTSYLEALRVLAAEDPETFEAVWELACARYEDDRRSYDLTAELGDVRHTSSSLLDDDSARRILHVTYGSVLSDTALAARLRDVLGADGGRAYADALRAHLGRHLEALV